MPPPRAVRGVLVECDPSIKSIIIQIDVDSGHEIVIEVLDDTHLVVKESKVQELKELLEARLAKTTAVEAAVEDDSSE